MKPKIGPRPVSDRAPHKGGSKFRPAAIGAAPPPVVGTNPAFSPRRDLELAEYAVQSVPSTAAVAIAKAVGYARVSTDDQTAALQSDAITRAGVDAVFVEQASGAAPDRPQLAAAIATLSAGDTLVVWRLDRLGRSLGNLIAIATQLRDRGVHLRSLTEGFDTSTASGRLLYHVLGAVAEFERESIRERTVAGMIAARRRGGHIGRPPALVGDRRAEAFRMLDAGKSQREVGRILRISRATIQRAVKDRAPAVTSQR